jgi:hypothetical protein
MKSKQLAHVLIKVMGLYVCLCAVPGLVSGILIVFSSSLGLKWSEGMFRLSSYAFGDAVLIVVGIFLIIKSRKLAEYWFKGEDE